MILRWLVQSNAYYDSVHLMRVSEELARRPGVVRAAAVMATPLNLDLLAGDDLLPAETPARPDDLLIAVLGEDEASADQALAQAEAMLSARQPAGWSLEGQAARPLRTLEQAATLAGCDLAVIAVPGPYAAAEAFAALRAGMHVFLFSDNVPLQEEVRLKRLAAERDLLMMGPDCGTAIIGGIGLGFANRVQRGPVGIVGASGTGVQQLCCLLDHSGVGIALAVGTGGRDLSAAVGGSMTRRALWALEADDTVDIIALISKPADPDTSHRLQRELLNLQKPAVICLLGEKPPDAGAVRYAATITDTARLIVGAVGGRKRGGWRSRPGGRGRPEWRPSETPRGEWVYGLFAGGTLCAEAAQVLDGMDVPHHLVDLGADEFTRGRPHPIIDPRLRAAMLADLAREEGVGAVLLDVILGDLAHPDPAGALAPALEQLRSSRVEAPLLVIAALVGTRHDPQGLEEQRSTLERAGVQVFASNAQAATAAGKAVRGEA